MKNLFGVLTLAIFAFLAAGCQKETAAEQAALNYIPAEAGLVLIANVPQLMQKADFESIKELPFYQEVLSGTAGEDPFFAEILASPEKAGVDLTQPMYICPILKVQDKDLKDRGVVTVWPLADQAAFERMLKEVDLVATPASNNFNQAKGPEQTRLFWNEKVAFMAIAADDFDLDEHLALFQNTTTKNSIGNNRNFNKLLGKSADMSMWVNSTPLMAELPVSAFAGIGNFTKEDLLDNYIHGTFNFEQGKMVAAGQLFLKKALTTDLDILFRDQPTSELASTFSQKGMLGTFSAALHSSGIGQLIIEKHQEGTSNAALENFGLTIEDFMNYFSGDVAGAVYADEQDPAPVMGFHLKNDEAGQELVNKLLAKDIIEKQGNYYQFKPFEQEVRYDTAIIKEKIDLKGVMTIRGSYLYVGKDETILAKALAGGNNIPEAKENIFYGWVNMDQRWGNDVDDELLQAIDRIETQSKRKESQATFYMKDSSQNSLHYLIQQMNETFEKNKQTPTLQDAPMERKI